MTDTSASASPPPPPPGDAEPGFDELRAVLGALPDNDDDATTAVLAALGGDDAGEWLAWLAGWQGRHRPTLEHARIALYADGRLPENRAVIAAILDRSDPIVDAADSVDADLKLYEMTTARPGEWTEAECCRAIAYGMTVVDDGIDLLLLVTPATEPAAHLAGIADAGGDVFDRLLRTASAPLAGLIGAVLAARMARVPVLLDGALADVARRLLDTGLPGIARHVRPVAGPADGGTALFEAPGSTRAADAVARLRDWLAQSGRRSA